jgi:hypothetical protein
LHGQLLNGLNGEVDSTSSRFFKIHQVLIGNPVSVEELDRMKDALEVGGWGIEVDIVLFWCCIGCMHTHPYANSPAVLFSWHSICISAGHILTQLNLT